MKKNKRAAEKNKTNNSSGSHLGNDHAKEMKNSDDAESKADHDDEQNQHPQTWKEQVLSSSSSSMEKAAMSSAKTEEDQPIVESPQPYFEWKGRER